MEPGKAEVPAPSPFKIASTSPFMEGNFGMEVLNFYLYFIVLLNVHALKWTKVTFKLSSLAQNKNKMLQLSVMNCFLFALQNHKKKKWNKKTYLKKIEY